MISIFTQTRPASVKLHFQLCIIFPTLLHYQVLTYLITSWLAKMLCSLIFQCPHWSPGSQLTNIFPTCFTFDVLTRVTTAYQCFAIVTNYVKSILSRAYFVLFTEKTYTITCLSMFISFCCIFHFTVLNIFLLISVKSIQSHAHWCKFHFVFTVLYIIVIFRPS